MTTANTVVVSNEERERFYVAAIAGLQQLDRRERMARRFGAEADARWQSFSGALTASDRIDFLLRDAAVAWGPAFSPADTFGGFGLAPDEPFSPNWQSLNSEKAQDHISKVPMVLDPRALGALMGVASSQIQIPALSASTRLVVAGGAALVSVAQAFAEQTDLSWSDQVLAVASTPLHRQLAGLLAIFAGAQSRTRLTRPDDDLRSVLKASGFAQIDAPVVSDDAEPSCAEFARRAAGVA